jgi:hypothetical protein
MEFQFPPFFSWHLIVILFIQKRFEQKYFSHAKEKTYKSFLFSSKGLLDGMGSSSDRSIYATDCIYNNLKGATWPDSEMHACDGN